jgi:hypothetical protein
MKTCFYLPKATKVFLKQMLDKTGIQEQIENCASLPVQYSNRGYAVPVILESFITSIWCGVNRFYIPKSPVRTGRWAKFLIEKLG